jgi:hypothetical protein
VRWVFVVGGALILIMLATSAAATARGWRTDSK